MNYYNTTYILNLKQQIIKSLLILIIIILFPFVLMSQTTVTLSSFKDNTLYEDTLGSISNGAGDHFFSGKTSTGKIRRGLIAFNIGANIPAGATISKVTLTLYMSKTIGGEKTIQLRKVNQNWGEGDSDALGEEGGGAPSDTNDATWIHTFYNTSLWSSIGGSFSSIASDSISVGAEDFYNWSSPQMVNDVQSWLNTPLSNYGWLLLGDESNFSTAKRFDTKENDSVNFRPKLNVTYVLNAIPLNLRALIEGFWNGSTMVSDTVKVYLRNATFPFSKVDSAKVKLDSLGKGNLYFGNATTGSYYIVFTHRNSIETWSKFPQTFMIGALSSYDFTTSVEKAFGNNLKLKAGKFTIYSGDVDQDGIVDASDISAIENAVGNFGYLRTDLNGDDFIDASDISIVENNTGVLEITPQF